MAKKCMNPECGYVEEIPNARHCGKCGGELKDIFIFDLDEKQIKRLVGRETDVFLYSDSKKPAFSGFLKSIYEDHIILKEEDGDWETMVKCSGIAAMRFWKK